MENELLKRLLQHVSSVSLAVTVISLYLMGDTKWLDPYLPENGKFLILCLLIGLVVVYELSILGAKRIDCKVGKLDLKVQEVLLNMEINSLVQAVNGLYGRFLASGDEFITNEYTIKELSDLTDKRLRLGVNSYTQGRLEFLNSKIKLG